MVSDRGPEKPVGSPQNTQNQVLSRPDTDVEECVFIDSFLFGVFSKYLEYG